MDLVMGGPLGRAGNQLVVPGEPVDLDRNLICPRTGDQLAGPAGWVPFLPGEAL